MRRRVWSPAEVSLCSAMSASCSPQPDTASLGALGDVRLRGAPSREETVARDCNVQGSQYSAELSYPNTDGNEETRPLPTGLCLFLSQIKGERVFIDD